MSNDKPGRRLCVQCGQRTLDRPDGRRCDHCLLAGRVAVLLDDGTGRINPALQPLATLLTSSTSPRAVYHMLRRGRAPATLLAELAAGRIELSHQGLDAYGPPRATTKVRNMLLAADLLPAVDQTVLDFERFARQRLQTLAQHPHQRLLRQFALWQQLPRMRAKAATRTLTYGAYLYAQQQFLAAESFLTWLASSGRQPAQLTQAQLDAWMRRARRSERERIRGFLSWTMATRRLPTLAVPVVPPRQREPITQQQRLELLRRLALENTTQLSARVIAFLVLLYAQPLSRIRTLTLDDITVDSDAEVYIGLGNPPSPVPQPFADLLLRLSHHREYPKTAAYAQQRWLFPGTNPGQPVNYMTLRKKLGSIGVPPRSTRVRALRQLVLQVPAAIVATALGLHQTTTHRHNVDAGGIWNRYAAGNH